MIIFIVNYQKYTYYNLELDSIFPIYINIFIACNYELVYVYYCHYQTHNLTNYSDILLLLLCHNINNYHYYPLYLYPYPSPQQHVNINLQYIVDYYYYYCYYQQNSKYIVVAQLSNPSQYSICYLITNFIFLNY